MKTLTKVTFICLLFYLLNSCEEKYKDSDGNSFPTPTKLDNIVGIYEITPSDKFGTQSTKSVIQILKEYPGNNLILSGVCQSAVDFTNRPVGILAVLTWDTISNNYKIADCDFSENYGSRNGVLSVNGDHINISYEIWWIYLYPDKYNTINCTGNKVK